MGAFEAVFLGGLIAVIIAQVIHRPAGAVLAVVWCIGAGAYGWYEIQQGAQVRFFGLNINPTTFLGTMVAMAVYNGWVAWRVRKRG